MRTTAEAEPRAAPAVTARTGEPDGPGPAPLTRVPRPPEGSDVAVLGVPAGGLVARQATWRPDGGELLLTGQAPFCDLTATAGFRADGSLDGTLQVVGAIRLMGLGLGEVTWQQSGWTPDSPLVAPIVALHGTRLAVDLAPVGPDAVLTAGPGVTATGDGAQRSLELPGDAVPGRPLDPGRVELFRALRGWDTGGLRVHPDAPVGGAPAFVSDADLFFGPGRYGPDSPEAMALLMGAVQAALAGMVGPVQPVGPAPPAQPDPGAEQPPAADTTPVPASVAPVPPVPTGGEEGRGEEAATPAAGGTGTEAAAGETGAPEVAPGAEAPAPSGASGGEGTAGSEGPAGGEQGGAPVELLMPPAPAAPGPAAQARMGGVAGGARAATTAATDLPSADADISGARGAVTEPVAETAARAQEGLAAALGERPAPSPEIVALVERIRTAIREHRPVDEDELLRTDPTREAQDAGATVSGSVQGQVDQVRSGYDDMSHPPAGEPALHPTPVEQPSASSPGMGARASSAAPDPIPPENLSLAGDIDATDQRIADAGVDTRVTQEIPDPPFATVREGRGELGELAEQTPAELAAEQTQAIEAAQADMADLQTRATQALQSARSGAVGDVAAGQTGATQSEHQTRDQAGQRAQQIFDTAQTQVTSLLDPLGRTAMSRWDSGLARVSQEFHDALDRVQDWIDERHSGVGGYVVALGDAVFGLPDWVIREYDRAERAFGDGVSTLLLDISTEVNGVVAAAQAIIAQARTDIDAVFTAMEAEFPEWAASERARFGGMLDGLAERATQAQTSFVRDVSQRATQAVAEAQAAVEERRDAARGVIGRVVAAIDAFLEDPVTAIINGLLTLVGIPPSAFWALVARIQQVVADIANDPETFINNLVAGLKQGFQQFFDNFGTHVLHGFWDWLFSGLETPIPMPTDLSPGSLFSFALQLMGVTWARVREILVRHIGERNVALIEAAWQVVSVLIEQGPQGLVDMVKERLSPEAVVQTILEAAVQYLIETLIQQVVGRVIGMLNPVGAVAQAIDLIYQVLSWVFRNAARIFRFVEAVVNGIANVMAGNISGMAGMVERALASLIPPVIDFLAGLLHLGGLPGEIAEVIVRLQTMVYQVLDLVVGTLAERGRALLASMGLGGNEEDGQGGDDELGTTVRFAGGGEAHRLFVRLAGTDATLMVASVPEAVQSKISEWEGLLERGKPTDARARSEAAGLLPQLSSVADQADAEGDQLAAAFLQAQADGPEGAQPPSDDALENRERAMAGMLGRLFTLFEQQDQAQQLRDIAAAMPAHAAARSAEALAAFTPVIEGPQHVPAGTQERAAIWDPAVVGAAASAAAATVAASSATHLALVRYFEADSPGTADSADFRDYALERTGTGHPVRAEFQRAYGRGLAQALHTDVPTSLDPVDDELIAEIGRIGFRAAGSGFGSLTRMPSTRDRTDPPLKRIAGPDLIGFLKEMARSGQAAGYTWSRLNWAWHRHTKSHDYLAGKFRGLRPRSHEWIPTNQMLEVVEYAMTAHDLSPGGVNDGNAWINLFNHLRSDTRRVFYRIDTPPVWAPGEPPLNPAGVGAHSGAAYGSQSGRGFAGTMGQADFHDDLRALFARQRPYGAAAFVGAALNNIAYRLWDGTLAHSGVPPQVWDQPIGFWFRVIGTSSRDPSVTLRTLGAEQATHWTAIQQDFQTAASHLND